tara:strand:+ start:330 stop:506 length:177 start_codon:yes stop_codon:yes gene_type:complete
MNKYQHIIDTLLDRDVITTVGKPKSTWYEKVYPKPRIWITEDTLKSNNKSKKKKKKKS